MDSYSLCASFLVRVWRNADSERGLRGTFIVEITHVQNRERRIVDSVPALLAFLREQSGDQALLAVKTGLR